MFSLLLFLFIPFFSSINNNTYNNNTIFFCLFFVLQHQHYVFIGQDLYIYIYYMHFLALCFFYFLLISLFFFSHLFLNHTLSHLVSAKVWGAKRQAVAVGRPKCPIDLRSRTYTHQAPNAFFVILFSYYYFFIFFLVLFLLIYLPFFPCIMSYMFFYFVFYFYLIYLLVSHFRSFDLVSLSLLSLAPFIHLILFVSKSLAYPHAHNSHGPLAAIGFFFVYLNFISFRIFFIPILVFFLFFFIIVKLPCLLKQIACFNALVFDWLKL